MEYYICANAYEIQLKLSYPASLILLAPSSIFPLVVQSVPYVCLWFVSFRSNHQTDTTQVAWCCTAFSDYILPLCCPPSPDSSPSFQGVQTIHLSQNPTCFLSLDDSLSLWHFTIHVSLLLSMSLSYGTTHFLPWIKNMGWLYSSSSPEMTFQEGFGGWFSIASSVGPFMCHPPCAPPQGFGLLCFVHKTSWPFPSPLWDFFLSQAFLELLI